MAKTPKKKRVTRDDWLVAALDAFSKEGESGVRIEVLARELGVAKAGFYWHFENREALLDALLGFWAHEYTEVIAKNRLVLGQPPKQRLLACLELIYTYKLASMDVHFQSWAQHDARVRRRVQRVIRQRLDFFREVFAELDFSPQAAEMRARLVLGYEANERLLFQFKSDKEARKFREMRCELLLAPEP